MKNPAVAEAKKLIAEGFDKKTADELEKLLEHPHHQVRLKPAIRVGGLQGRRRVGQGGEGVEEPTRKAACGLGVGDGCSKGSRRLWLNLPVRCLPPGTPTSGRRPSKALGDAGVGVDWVHVLYPLLKDPEPRVRFQAAIATGRPLFLPPSIWNPSDQLGSGTKALFEMLQENADRDLVAFATPASLALANLARSFTDGTLTVGAERRSVGSACGSF